MTVFRGDYVRIDHDQWPDDPPGVSDVLPWVTLLAFVAVLPLAVVWLVLGRAWQVVTRWR